MEKINIAELLKDCPKGMELDCSLFDGVIFDEIVDDEECDWPILIKTKEGETWSLTSTGCWDDSPSAKCVIFLKGKTTWEGFHRPFKGGDIVALDSEIGVQLFIFKEYTDAEKDYAHCYMMLDDDGTVSLECGDYYVERFATEEEKEELFQAIKDKGYRWNAETKTLEKLLKFKVGDRARHKTHIGQGNVVTEVKDTHYILDDELALPFISQDDYELVPNKFDVSTLKPFDKVLARDTRKQVWIADIFSHKVEKQFGGYTFACIGHYWNQCIPYVGNEHLLGTTDDCIDFYKTVL